MSDQSRPDHVEIDIQYSDAGYSMVFDMDDWYNKIKEDFTSFETIRDYYRTDPKEHREKLAEGFKEIEPGEERGGPGIVINNPPVEWKEDSSEAAQYIEFAHRQLVELGLSILIEDEIEAQEHLIEQGQYKPLVVRQSAFYEDLLKFQSMLGLQSQKESTLSSSEFSIIRKMGHKDRVRFARLLGVIDQDEHDLLQEMASWRNKIAHNAWPEFDPQDESQIQSVAERVHDMLQSKLVNPAEEMEQLEPDPVGGDDFIGFSALEVELQNLQLGVLDLLRQEGGRASLSYVQKILTQDPETIRQRCYRMDHIGYLEVDENQSEDILELTQDGRDLLDEYWPSS